uniref:Uncharacterized protein n=1 Tax=Anguilla anguilla TaxID=7936 RepID=A0A0E9VK97_ANGAN
MFSPRLWQNAERRHVSPQR